MAQGGLSVAGVVIVVYIVLRQVEDQLVMPIVIGRAVHLHPIVTIFAVLIGLEVYGILGGLLGVPAAAAVNVVFHTLYPRGVHLTEPMAAGHMTTAEAAAAAGAAPITRAASGGETTPPAGAAADPTPTVD